MRSVHLNTFKPYWFLLVFFAALLLGFSLAAAEEWTSSGGLDSQPLGKANEKYAVLVGVDEYEKLNGLRFAAADVNMIRERLLELEFDPDHIFTLTSGAGAANLPLKRIIEERIGQVLDMAGPDDMIFLAFCGHGVQIGKTVYFCSQDTQEEVVDTAVSITGLIKKLESSPARFKWMVIDACRENPFKSRTANPNARSIQKLDDPPRGLVVLQSCGNTELSYEDEDYRHGLFSYSFSEGLKGAADIDGDGRLTLTEICKYTTEETVNASLQRFGARQRPYMSGEMSDFVIIDGLLIEGLPKPTWDEADGIYEEACLLRKKRRYREAQGKIREALKLTEGASAESSKRQAYLDEDEDIKERLEMQDQLEAEKKARLEAEARARQTAASQGESPSGVTPPVPSSVPSDATVQSAPLTAPAVRVNKLGVGTQAGEKKTITAKGIDYTFCWCPAGTFTMGSPRSERGREYNETQHRVTLTHGFWLLESEVTQEMWENVMGTNPAGGKGVGARYPVYNVSWNDSVEFCLKLSELTGERVQLPMEAQWEYACRAGSDGPYAGTGKLDEMGWYIDNSGRKTHEVKGKNPNAWGLYDMHGNVYEWCSDWDGDYPRGTVTDPKGPDSGSDRVNRGGSWNSNARFCRSACRSCRGSTDWNNDLGFRPSVVPAD